MTVDGVALGHGSGQGVNMQVDKRNAPRACQLEGRGHHEDLGSP